MRGEPEAARVVGALCPYAVPTSVSAQLSLLGFGPAWELCAPQSR